MKDWVAGAVGMLLVLVAGVVVLWWVLSDPADDTGGGPVPPGDAGTAPGTQPPDDLGEDDVWLADLVLDAGTVVTPESRLRDVRALAQDVVTGPAGLVAATVTVDATVPFEVVAAELGEDTVVSATEGGQAMVVRTVEVLGRELRAVATGTVEVVDGRLLVEPRSIDLGGPDFLSEGTAAVVRRLVTIEHEIEGLPAGLVLQEVAVQDDGFRAELDGVDVRLVP